MELNPGRVLVEGPSVQDVNHRLGKIDTDRNWFRVEAIYSHRDDNQGLKLFDLHYNARRESGVKRALTFECLAQEIKLLIADRAAYVKHQEAARTKEMKKDLRKSLAEAKARAKKANDEVARIETRLSERS